MKGDFILTPNVPAMVAPGDEFSVTVGVFNNTSGKDPIRVQVQASRELTLTSPAELRSYSRRETRRRRRVPLQSQCRPRAGIAEVHGPPGQIRSAY